VGLVEERTGKPDSKSKKATQQAGWLDRLWQ
jgi:hypothetical protein